ncbi:hypothetical protein [Mycolicibacterium holsaticum]|uniref:Diacylglycerol O-acyltransferase n=1 Tax=Mycolicibacterium holsaticum TaxID=152142 RepID=A0A1E3RU92_9MYCO|nr:hypothetical protein [Mycolicibacterium holsaticum]ODQ93485.1 hypothetical protein BHQ17_13120 [Mycolicibacterium holsaticum]QZA13551.1 hypothetical protein K3U96_05145 [Mycolicibacterium holsaticum DSM 44478 = JCM 12374]UNC08984.1 hypothetical protein H5U41_21690 [Mycolicibacterium holsaticum DSM 44478 = JCM 12374]
MDQASYLWVRASGHVHGIQCTWVYRREVDHDGLRRVHDNLAHGLLGRRVEPSALPFGRHRWVSCHELPGIDVANPVDSRDAVTDWFDERARVPIDPEFGPCWHLGVLPIEGYGTAVTLVASHTVVDGVGTCIALTDAVKGVRRDLRLPPPGARPKRQALVEDFRQTLRGLPEIGDALRATVTVARQNRPTKEGPGGQPSAPKPNRKDNRPAMVPGATIYIDGAEWDTRAESLGGTSNALMAGFAAKLAEKYGRLRGDGLVTLSYPINDRTENDMRANALKGIDFPVDPRPVTSDLRKIRNDFRETINAGLGKFKEQERAFPLTPFVPTIVLRKLPLAAMNADLTVGCSNFGEMDPAVAYVDGSEADYYGMRMVEQNLTANSPEVASGELYVASGRVAGKLFVSFRAYHPNWDNSRQALLEKISATLADFELTAFIE